MRPADIVRGRRRLRRSARRAPAALAMFAAVAVLIAGCGGGSSPGVASIPGTGKSGGRSSAATLRGGGARAFAGFAPTPAQRAQFEVTGLVFARCMRSHGVPDFPDPPSASGGAFGFVFGSGGIDPAAPLFRIAQQRCSSVFSRRRVLAG